MFLIDSVDSMILYHLILILLSNIFFSIVGLLSQSRYAIISTVRGLVHIISLDIFITLVYSLLVFTSQSTNFHDFVLSQDNYWYLWIYAPIASIFIVILFLESKRAPFDHAETESEVVAGYATEYNGPMMLMFFLCEYMHLIISAIHFILFFCGGWYLIHLSSLLPLYFTPYTDVFSYSILFHVDLLTTLWEIIERSWFYESISKVLDFLLESYNNSYQCEEYEMYYNCKWFIHFTITIKVDHLSVWYVYVCFKK
jgi:NADH:ubiquinone oxidoreductase subunit H